MKIKKYQELVSGWGKTNKVNMNIFQPQNIIQLQEFIRAASPKSLISRGFGKSYGDSSQLRNQFAVDLINFNKIELDLKNKLVTAGAGVSIEELLKVIIPKGFFLPVTAGTKKITIGGALASDIHGKNHYLKGSFGNYVKEITIIDANGIVHKLTPDEDINNFNSNYFWATIGGMGLTGVIVQTIFQVMPIKTSYMKVKKMKFFDIKKLMKKMIFMEKKCEYSVAWIDISDNDIRGVLTCADHASFEDLNKKQKKYPLLYNNKSDIKIPNLFVKSIINKFTIKVFNEIFFKGISAEESSELQKIKKYFYPLDNLENWNNVYGPSGFIQYQFVLPDEASHLVVQVIKKLQEISASSFLTVLKRFGRPSKGFLSFPKAGWTLSIDLQADIPNLFETLQDLDLLISKNNGRFYLAKDSRMSKSIFLSSYKSYYKWKKIKDLVDPKNKFYSDQAKRLMQ